MKYACRILPVTRHGGDSSAVPRCAASARMAVALSLALATGMVDAQVRTPPPDSGQLLQEIRRPPPPPPSSDTGLKVEKPAAAQASSQVPIPVKAIEITGNTLLPTAQLHALVASGEGQTLTLDQLDALAARITAAYHDHGYPLDSAYVPAQTMRNGVVRMVVIEARYGQVVLQNDSTTSDHPLRATLAPLAPGTQVEEGKLDRSLLLLSDIPGVAVNSVLRPGDVTGTSDLVVTATSAQRYQGTLGLDDYGNRYTGRARLSGELDINSLLHQGDELDVNAITSGSDMKYGHVGYRYLLNGYGTVIGAAVSALDYDLGHGLSALQAHGTAQVQSIYVSQPIIRSRAGNLYGQIEYDHQRLYDDVDLTGIQNNRHTNTWTATLAGDHRDSSGIFNASASVTYGHLYFNNDLAAFLDLLGPQTKGSFTRYNLTLARLQQLSANNSLYIGYSQQWSNKNLDTSQQFYLGGPNTVRGYDVGVITGAEGSLATLEFRHNLGVAMSGTWLGTLFADTGRVQPYKDAFVPGPNSARTTSAGVGLRWSGPQLWTASATFAVPVGTTPQLLRSTPGITDCHLWVAVQKGF